MVVAFIGKNLKPGGDILARIVNQDGVIIAMSGALDISLPVSDGILPETDSDVAALAHGGFAIAYEDAGWGTGSDEITLRL